MTSITLSFISFINYFLVPVIGLKIYKKRRNQLCKVSVDSFMTYVQLLCLNLIATRPCANMIEQFTNTMLTAETVKYTIVSIGVMLLLVFTMEILEKFVHIDITIQRKEVKDDIDDEKNMG